MANLSSGFVQGPATHHHMQSGEKPSRLFAPDISVAKGQHKGPLQWKAINRFYIGSFFIRLPHAWTAVPSLSALTFTEHQKQPHAGWHPTGPLRASSCSPHQALGAHQALAMQKWLQQCQGCRSRAVGWGTWLPSAKQLRSSQLAEGAVSSCGYTAVCTARANTVLHIGN